MRQWGILYRKEMLEMTRNYKWVWVPLVFILFGIMQPVTFYYLPQILKAAGNMPEGAVIEMPSMSGGDVLAQTLSQYGTLGILIIVLAFMAVLSGERTSGVAELILVKPVSYISYVTSKWAGMLSLTAVSFLLGYAASWYYTNELIGAVPFEHVIGSFLIYLLWLVFIVTLTMLFSAIFKSYGGIAFLTMGSVIVLSIVTNFFPKGMSWSPSNLSAQAAHAAVAGLADIDWLWPVVATTIGIAIFKAAAVLIVRGKEQTG